MPSRAGILNVLSCFINIRRIFRSIVFMQANIFKIKRNELADGSGLRTTIYFKGCPLRCVWCSTPQAHERPTRILWDSKHCLYCNLCVSECPTGSLAFSDNRLTFTPDTCTFCRACTDHCPSRMLHFVGQGKNPCRPGALWKWRRHSLRRRSADAAGSSHRCPEKM